MSGTIFDSGNTVVNKINRTCQLVENSLEKNKILHGRKRVLGGVFICRVVKEGFTAKVAFMRRSERTKGTNAVSLGWEYFRQWEKPIKGPEAGVSFLCWKNKEANLAGTEWEGVRRKGQRGSRHLDHTAMQTFLRTLMLTLWEIRNHWRSWAKDDIFTRFPIFCYYKDSIGENPLV